MSKADIVIILILALGGFLGYRRGFLTELFFLIAIVLGVLIGFKLMGAGVDYLHRHFNADTSFLPYLSFLLIFLGVVVVVVLLGKTIKNSVDKTFLGRLDEAAGCVLGVVKYAFCISVVIWLAASLHYPVPSSWTRGSVVFPVAVKLAPAIAGFLGGFIPIFREIFKQY